MSEASLATGMSEGWRESAICKDLETDMFFPIGNGDRYTMQVEAAKAVCRQCVVQTACLDFALQTKEDHGIYGGATPEERRRMVGRSRRGRKPI